VNRYLAWLQTKVAQVGYVWLLMQVLVNLHSAHMDPDDWQNPKQFRPERFIDEAGNVVGKNRIIPFGLGTSTCMLTLCVSVL